MKELLEKYPKAAKIIKEFYMEKMLKTLENKGLPEDFKDHVREQGIQDDMIVRVMEEGPRNLFDVFDQNEIYINIEVHVLHPNTIYCKYHIPPSHKNVEYKTRIEAEKASIIDAFELLETKLG